jgi:hypothetical protein
MIVETQKKMIEMKRMESLCQSAICCSARGALAGRKGPKRAERLGSFVRPERESADVADEDANAVVQERKFVLFFAFT